MKQIKIIAIFSLFIAHLSCKSDDSRSCTTCSAPLTLDFELCEESDGNASVNGENTGTPYALYLEDLRAEGTTCGGG